jgi:uncharacterized protein (TIGR03083 family)
MKAKEAAMTAGAVDALRADRTSLLELCSTMTDADWKAPSGCAGWSVQDLVAHMGALYWLVVDRSALPDVGGAPTEAAQELYVESRRSWSATQVVDDYADVSEQALERLSGLEGVDAEVPLGDLGTYPMSLIPNAYAFDHYTHIRADLFAPRGPFDGPRPASDELRLVPTLAWIAAAAAQQNAEALASVTGAIAIEVTGPAATTMTIGSGDVAATVTCSAHDLVLWSTQRATWDDLGVRATGRDDVIAAARRLHVY